MMRTRGGGGGEQVRLTFVCRLTRWRLLVLYTSV